MFEKFTDRARKVLALANQEAKLLNHEYIGTEHILVGLLKEGRGAGAAALINLGIDLQNVKMQVEKLMTNGPDTLTTGKLPQTPAAKKVIGYAIEESQNLGHNYVGTEHILLGLLRHRDGVAAQILMNLGLKLDAVQEQVRKISSVGASAQDQTEGQKDVLDTGTIGLQEPMRMGNRSSIAGAWFLTMLQNEHDIPARALVNLGINLKDVVAEVKRLLAERK